ncbi:MAG: copper chaperone PCu(A)C [Phenylobacterium sp.]
MKLLTLAAAACLIALPAAAAGSYRLGGLEVVQPWSRPAVAGSTGAGFMTLTNRGAAPMTLTGAESPLAARVEIHRSSVTGGVMRMMRETQVVVPAGGQVAFGPGGLHLMLVGLKRPLRAGDEVPVILAFNGGQRLKVAFAVGAGMGPQPMGNMHH